MAVSDKMKDAERQAQSTSESTRQHIKAVLIQNWVGSKRALLASLNEFRYWKTEQVSDLFRLLPPTGAAHGERKLYPLGPVFRPPPDGMRRWIELGGKILMLAAIDGLVLLFSPFFLLASKEERAKATSGLSTLHTELVSSSLFIKAPLSMMEKAGKTQRALCVNKSGRFRLMSSGYAAISHVWMETMGYEYQNVKANQDDRGLNRHHFQRIMAQVEKSGVEWVWFDLLSIPKGTCDTTKRIKTMIVNSLQKVYRNADMVVVLDALTLQLNSEDPLIAASILSCGAWLSRVWTYQEAKLARQVKIITAGRHPIDFQEMVVALKVAEQQDPLRWHEIRLTFDRLLPHWDLGVSLPDIALSCTHRATENDKDYAKAFFACLNLTWTQGWSYEDGMMEILHSRPQDATRLAFMHGPRGLPAPFSWAPRSLAHLQGKIHGGLQFRPESNGLQGYCHTARVCKLLGHFVSESLQGVVCNLVVLDKNQREVQIQISLYPGQPGPDIENWMSRTIPDGKARLLSCDPMVQLEFCHVALLVEQEKGLDDEFAFEDLDARGRVVGSAVINHGSVDSAEVRWCLQ